MMQIFKNKSSVQKIVIALIMLILFNFIFPIYSSAALDGGTLAKPVKQFVAWIGDITINLLQRFMLPGAPEAVVRESIEDYLADKKMEEAEGIFENADAVRDKAISIYYHIPILGDVTTGINDWLFSALGLTEPGEMKALTETRAIPNILYSPGAIFTNKIPALDVNFIDPSVYYNGGTIELNIVKDSDGLWILESTYTENKTPTDDDKKYSNNTAYWLQDTIATWYVALRNIAIVGLLSVLVYVAIRIIMSSTAGETAKYKSMLKDWLVAMCILFFIHYMMAFLLKTSDMLIDLLDDNVVNANSIAVGEVKGDLVTDFFMNKTRTLGDIATDDDGKADLSKQFGYIFIYVILVFYTLMFTWKYLKRLVYLAFLTMIAPLVALSYPIDKMHDGNAQAFNMWFKEYVFNVLIQPIHLLLYTILITSADEFAKQNMIYAIVAIGFMLEAEKIIKSMFGLNKAEGGVMSSAITGGAIFGTVAGLVQKRSRFIRWRFKRER